MKLFFSIILWSTWMERNRIVFKEGVPETGKSIAAFVNSLQQYWLIGLGNNWRQLLSKHSRGVEDFMMQIEKSPGLMDGDGGPQPGGQEMIASMVAALAQGKS